MNHVARYADMIKMQERDRAVYSADSSFRMESIIRYTYLRAKDAGLSDDALTRLRALSPVLMEAEHE